MASHSRISACIDFVEAYCDHLLSLTPASFMDFSCLLANGIAESLSSQHRNFPLKSVPRFSSSVWKLLFIYQSCLYFPQTDSFLHRIGGLALAGVLAYLYGPRRCFGLCVRDDVQFAVACSRTVCAS